ncbi:uncharacterized protein LOC110699839 [Chenopodium quinoa]|uniref:uncharacterized protein LOC110699839 n=1 Tax=Chenopodium quinoa TaxID=63459 RepID=UPI000B787048|nr:uncharacterized protein LOC110699839 [Chenopodium quinoa]
MVYGPPHPNMQRPHPNELALLTRLAAKEALASDDDDEEEKAETQVLDAARTSMSSVADTEKVCAGKKHTNQVPDPITSCVVHTVQNFLDEEESRAVKHITRADKYISPREYYAYKLQIRPKNMLLRGGRCFQQFVVDMYVKIENLRLDYLRNNQDIIRADLYQGILDSVLGGETDASKIGHLVVLPPSFLGCPRDLKRRYLNAMALVQRGPKEYDKFVCAEISLFDNPHLRKVVLTHMMHGPCGKLNPKCPCMKMDGRKLVCKNGYPKDYNFETANNKDGYPIYRRRQIGEKVCSTIKAVKYLYKYVYKGHDRISFKISATNDNKVDEIEQFESGRWVSPCEGVWRIFGFDLYEIYPPVMPLPIHLPYMQSIAVRPHENLKRVVRDPKRSRTPLTEYFAMNFTINGGINLLYGEFPEHYRWDASTKEWKGRKNTLTVVGRISFVLPAEDLCTVDNYVCATFQETAKRLGLLEDDDAASICLAEAAEVQLPGAFRRLFATVLIFFQPSDPSALWEKYYTSLSEDFRYQFKDCTEKIKQLTVSLLEQHLESIGKSLKTFGLDHLSYNVSDEFRKTRDIADALNTAILEEFINSKERLNPAQLKEFDYIMKHVNEGKGEIRIMNKIVLPTALSGIAASNLPSGRTAYSRFKIPVDHKSCFTCDVPKQSSLAHLIKETTLIIWDEASMTNKANLQALDLLLQDICENTTLFGGKLIIFGGDFRQVLPIVPQKTLRQAVESSIIASYIWPSLKRFKLTENQRAREDLAFCSFLLSLGNGE